LDGVVAVEGIYCGVVGDIEGFAFEEFLFERAEAKSDTAERVSAVGDGELEVVAIGADFSGRRAESEAFCSEEGFRVSLAEWAKQLQLGNGFIIKLRQRYKCIDIKDRGADFTGQMVGGVTFECICELLNAFRLEGDARGHCVAAEGYEVFGAGGDGGEDIEAGNGASRTLGESRGGINDNSGPVEPVDDSGGDDTDNAAVPGRVGEDDGFSFGVVEPVFSDELAGVVEDFSLEPLALSVLAFEVFSDLCGVRKRGRGEQLNGESRMADASGGVKHRRESKTNVVAVEAPSGKFGGVD